MIMTLSNATLPLYRRLLLSVCAAGALGLAGCAVSETPQALGDARSSWERRRAAAGSKGAIIVSVSNVKVGKGSVHVGLYDIHTQFPGEGLDLATAMAPADADTVDLRFDAVPYGKYAVAVFQDENGNGRLDTTLGIPTEPYGFSNGATAGITGTPTFERASFDVGQAMVRQRVVL